jgi:hypothetical protein
MDLEVIFKALFLSVSKPFKFLNSLMKSTFDAVEKMSLILTCVFSQLNYLKMVKVTLGCHSTGTLSFWLFVL